MRPLEMLSELWSTTRFGARGVSSYAERLMVDETRKGVMVLAFVFLLILFGSILVSIEIGLERSYVYTCAALAALSVHVWSSARRVQEIGALHALGMTLLVISGVAFVLLAHRTGSFGAALIASTVLLFMVVPMVPWGLREACLVTLLIYTLFSASTWSAADRFSPQTLWTLQAFMLGAATVSLTLVARGTQVRKGDISARFELETAQRELERLSFQDPLTGAWNRRFLEMEFDGFAERVRKCGGVLHVALLDVDCFKELNDCHGHAFGDRVLTRVAQSFQQVIGDAGALVRTGGDEFVVLLSADEPEMLIADALELLRERTRRDSEAGDVSVTLSVGLASVPPELVIGLEGVYRAADDALYRAKRARGEGREAGQLVRVALTRSPRRNAQGP